MKKNTILLAALLISTVIYSQVGINTETPKATLDIAGKAADTTVFDGIIAPRLTGIQLRAKTYTTDQTGALVYITAADTSPAGQTLNVTSIGYYYFNGTQWISTGNTGGSGANIYNTNGALTSGRSLTNNGFSLTFLGSEQSTIWSPTGGFTQKGGSGSKRASIVLSSDDNNSDGVSSNMQLFQDPENLGQMTVGNDSRGLNIGSTSTTQPSSVTFMTSAGSGANGTEKLRITPTGNIGINTGLPTEKLDNNGLTRLRSLPLNGAANAINTTAGGTASSGQDQTFSATRTVVADANGVLGYVTGLPSTGGTPPSGAINVGETISQVYTVPTATANVNTFNLGTYITTNSLPALPIIDGLQINLQGVSASYYDPRIYNVSSASQLISFQSFATQVNQNRTSLNNTVTAGNYLQIDSDNLVFWTTTAAEVETANVQVQIDANTYRWYEFKWWCMEISGAKKIFLSVTRKA